MPRLQRAKTCIQAIDKGLEFLTSLQAEDGSLGPEASTAQAVHKLPLVLASAGRVEEAQRLLNWTADNLRDEDGTFRVANVPAAWLVIGAQNTGRFDLSLPTLERMAADQGANIGGVYERTDGARSRTYHVVSTAAAAWAFLGCGRIDEARKAGMALEGALRSQPRGKIFHARFNHAGAPAEEAEPDGPDRPLKGLHHALDKGAAHQQFDILGLPQLALAKLYLALGDEVFLAAAKGYAHVGHRVDQHVWLNVSGWANAWGEAVLYRMTRRRRYLRYAERLVGYLIDNQQDNGAWVHTDHYETLDLQPVGVTADVTATALHALIECLREVQ